MSLLERLFPANRRCGVWLLLDPDGVAVKKLVNSALSAEKAGADCILIGGSFIADDCFETAVSAIKSASGLPVVIFPGSSRQVSKHADGILFTSLLSGRNPQFLISEQVQAAPNIRKLGLEAISTAYLLIESGEMTATEFVSNTKPLPRNKAGLVSAHAMAAELFGMQIIYLEAGSGVRNPVPAQIVKRVSTDVALPVIVGGGIINSDIAVKAAKAGAKAIVVGTAVEDNGTGVLAGIVSALSSLNS